MALLRHKKFIANEDFIELVIDNQKLRLLAKAAKHVYVTPETLARFTAYEEDTLKLSDFARTRPCSKKEFLKLMKKYDIEEKTAIFLAISRKRFLEKVLLGRLTYALEDSKAREIIEENHKNVRALDYKEFIQTYEMVDKESVS